MPPLGLPGRAAFCLRMILGWLRLRTRRFLKLFQLVAIFIFTSRIFGCPGGCGRRGRAGRGLSRVPVRSWTRLPLLGFRVRCWRSRTCGWTGWLPFCWWSPSNWRRLCGILPSTRCPTAGRGRFCRSADSWLWQWGNISSWDLGGGRDTEVVVEALGSFLPWHVEDQFYRRYLDCYQRKEQQNLWLHFRADFMILILSNKEKYIGLVFMILLREERWVLWSCDGKNKIFLFYYFYWCCTLDRALVFSAKPLMCFWIVPIHRR